MIIKRIRLDVLYLTLYKKITNTFCFPFDYVGNNLKRMNHGRR